MAKIKMTVYNYQRRCGEIKTSYTAGGIIKWYSHFAKKMDNSSNVNYII